MPAIRCFRFGRANTNIGSASQCRSLCPPDDCRSRADRRCVEGQATGDKEGDAAWCNYEFANGKDAMEVWVFPSEAIGRGRAISKNPVTVKGLGDEAFMDRGMHGLNYVNLYVKKGHTTINVSIQETAGDEEKVKALAEKALRRF
ncbi:MAG: hypothetical protein LZF62_480152 [Nitrospira sp.]|nr:MAG: hypothetical protein LZF62_480152 [Nitrospira sp.]